ncbi:MAG TPA: ABC transporter permease [Caldithrix abyssi]|uniref:ABC transporter permease n=1 Tax=Caldithrix abyssi TaxID=187145 RepID=A0A7V5PN05_CALAY|nr:ABC transporter permease [Caldithrix abyssi]
MISRIERIGDKTIRAIHQTGEVFILLWQVTRYLGQLWKNRKLLFYQMEEIGVRSIPLVMFVGVFAGAVASVQTAYQLQGYISFNYLGAATSVAIFIELGPVLTALVAAGRVGASIAAEIGTMQVTEQIDALNALAIDPVRYLAMPRIVSGFIMIPVLTIIADFVGILGAYVVAYLNLDLPPEIFFGSVKEFFTIMNVMSGLIKAFVFGGVTAIIGCYVGFSTTGGAEGVGHSTIRAFVLSSALILLNDYLLSVILF